MHVRQLISALLLLLLSACVVQPSALLPTSTLPPTSPPVPTLIITATPGAPALGPVDTPAEQPALAAQPGPCEHLLWPLRDGSTWIYRLTGPDGAAQEIVLQAAVDEFGAVLTAGGETRALICGGDALAGLPPLPIAHPTLGSAITGTNPNGNLLPPPSLLLPLGQPAGWDMEITAGGAITLPGAEGAVTSPITGGKIVLIHDTGDLETVTTPAGEFLALPVDRDALFDVQVPGAEGDTTESVIVSASSRLHYAEGVGLVRAEYLGGMVSTPEGAWPLEPGTLLELISYTFLAQ